MLTEKPYGDFSQIQTVAHDRDSTVLRTHASALSREGTGKDIHWESRLGLHLSSILMLYRSSNANGRGSKQRRAMVQTKDSMGTEDEGEW